jgi:hypothetical protein
LENDEMAAAALTPRVRMATFCDRVRESPTEAGVFHLRGVRQQTVAPAFPYSGARLSLFAVLSSPRSGTYPGYVRVVDEATDKAIQYSHMSPPPHFDADTDTLAIEIRIGCSFPRPGRYSAEIWFYQKEGSDILKAEVPFWVTSEGD